MAKVLVNAFAGARLVRGKTKKLFAAGGEKRSTVIVSIETIFLYIFMAPLTKVF